MSASTPIIHALLIGIDCYRPNKLYKNLKGAVRDITFVETFLKKTLKIPAEQICALISPNPEDTVLLEVRSAQAPEPTYENIVRAFGDITTKAHKGEQVYIHYSGHGGRAKTVYPNLKRGTGEQVDEGIVPMDIGDTEEGRYLRDIEMTTLLKRMTDKGLVVTVVLDSCHSGGATRGDAEIRSAGQTDNQPRSANSLVAEREELEKNWLESKNRGLIGQPEDARDYVLLAACRPNEYAYEYAVNGGTERYGALTYWMVDTLTSVATRGQPLTYKLLHDRINAKIQSKFQAQIPMVLGESDRLVFGSETWSTPYTVSVITVTATTIKLNAGQAQGLSKGTRFSIYPLHTTDFSDSQKQIAIVEVTRVDASECTAKILKAEEGGISTQEILESGAPAIMVSAPVELIQRVRLTDTKVEGKEEGDLPATLVDRQKEALDKVRQALAGNGWVVEEGPGESALYQIAVDRQGNYEICNNVPIQTLRPLLSIDDLDAGRKVVSRLVHLAKYKAVEELDNSSSKLAKVLKVDLLTEDRQPFPEGQPPTVQSEDIVCLRLSNQGTQPLKVAILDLEPTWEISQIAIGGDESSFFNLERGAEEEILLRLRVPNDDAYEATTEIIKVFAVQRGLADFRWLTLPVLDVPSGSRGAQLNEDLRGQLEECATRGEESEGVNPLNSLLAMIGADLDQVPNAMRSASVVVDPRQEWVTKQVQIIIER